jgi:hypothetical protein
MALDDAGSRLRALGWHQGALIAVSARTELAALLAPGFDHAIVASQDCDIIAPVSLEATVDLLPAAVGAEPSGDLLYGKHPRRLCVALENGQFATVDIRRRTTVAKGAVAAIPPIAGASAKLADRKLLAKWLGKRYSRHAFPDAFNERLRAQRSQLEGLSKRSSSRLVTAILLQLETEDELDPNEVYKIALWFACRPNDAEDPESRRAIEDYAAAFASVLSACPGVHVDDFEVRSHLDINLDELEIMKRFDFDYRSEAPSPGGEAFGAGE